MGGYYLFAGLLVAFLIVFRVLQLSHVGWAFRALRDDEMAAELAGVNVSRYRIYAATVGSAMIGLTGALLAYSAGFISPATYSFDRVDVRVLVMVAFGGLGTLLGPVIGAAVFAVLDEQADGKPRAARGPVRRLRHRDLPLLQAGRRAGGRLARRPVPRPAPTRAARPATVSRVGGDDGATR